MVEKIVEEAIAAEGQKLIGWRDVPVDNSDLGAAREGGRAGASAGVHRPRRRASTTRTPSSGKLFLMRKVVSNRIYEMGDRQDRRILPRLDVVPHHRLQGHGARASARRPITRTCSDPRFETALALVHQRFATNTFPSWRLAHPYRHGRA